MAPQPAPPRTGDMTETNKSRKPARPGGTARRPERSGNKFPNPEGAPDTPETSYTPRQQETIRKGLRIWARVAIRSYLRKKVGPTHTESCPVSDPVKGEED